MQNRIYKNKIITALMTMSMCFTFSSSIYAKDKQPASSIPESPVQETILDIKMNSKTAMPDSMVDVHMELLEEAKEKVDAEIQRQKEEAERIAREQAEAEAKRLEEEAKRLEAEKKANQTRSYTWNGSVLTKAAGVNYGPNGKETYYNLPMDGVISIMRSIGNTDSYWVRNDGVKMLGDYIMIAADLNVHPRGSLVETSLGTGIVCDTGSFAYSNHTQVDIAVTW